MSVVGVTRVGHVTVAHRFPDLNFRVTSTPEGSISVVERGGHARTGIAGVRRVSLSAGVPLGRLSLVVPLSCRGRSKGEIQISDACEVAARRSGQRADHQATRPTGELDAAGSTAPECAVGLGVRVLPPPVEVGVNSNSVS